MIGSDFLTRREKIYRILVEAEKPLTAEEIAKILGLSGREVNSIHTDLEHVMRSVRKRSGNSEIVEMIPARCLTCGYTFRDREKVKRPSKCPKCNSERIEGPWFYIRKKGRK
ncbi:MAG: HTH domain-containing protein [Fervidicoccaceae archaeon]